MDIMTTVASLAVAAFAVRVVASVRRPDPEAERAPGVPRSVAIARGQGRGAVRRGIDRGEVRSGRWRERRRPPAPCSRVARPFERGLTVSVNHG